LNNVNFVVKPAVQQQQKQQPFIVFCLPGPTGGFSGKFFDAFVEIIGYCIRSNIRFMISRRESSVVYYVRNMCLGGNNLLGEDQIPFDGKVPYTHLMWIDSDVIFKPEQLQQLLDYDRDIVSGIYMMGNGIHFATVEDWSEDYFKTHGSFEFWTEKHIEGRKGLTEVDYTGLGFMLVKHGVFEAIKYPWFRPIFYDIGKAHDFCSEDVAFCKLARQAGYKIFVDPTIRVGHEKRVVL
jgi:hypothetical protein